MTAVLGDHDLLTMAGLIGPLVRGARSSGRGLAPTAATHHGRGGPRLITAVVILAVIASVLALGSGHHGVHTWNAAVPVIVTLLVLRRLAHHR